MDGVRINLKEGWVLIRPSNTSPVIRMTIEADNEETIEELAIEFKGKLMESIIEIQARR